jgi:RHS repeat-associated protein
MSSLDRFASLPHPAALALLLCSLSPSIALAQNGVTDDRVSLPDGPGSIGGVGENIGVNANMGSASFNVTIRVPVGQTPGTTPDLALSYSSGAGLGLAGIGWMLDVPTIERMVSKGLPTYTVTDLFAANGASELSYARDAASAREYRARYEGGFVRYRWHDAGAGDAGYWTAEYPDGSVGTFGATADGTLVPSARVEDDADRTFRYHLVERVDAVGRRVVYTYTKDMTDGWPLLDEVHYGFGTSTTPYFKVRVSYEDRPDVTVVATPGHVIRMSQRIAGIDVLSNDVVIRSYALNYEAALDSGGLSRLQTVSEYGRDGGKTAIEHSFAYSRSLGGTCTLGCEQPFLVDMGTLSGVSMGTGRAALIDINGDSLPDVVASDDVGDHTFYIADLSVEGRPSFGNPTGTSSTMGGTNDKLIIGSPYVQLFDVNGDGFTDIVDRVNGVVLCNRGSGDWESDGCASDTTQLPTLADDPNDAASGQDPLHMRFFDYDNDKRADLLETASPASATVYRNTGTAYEPVAVPPLEAQFDEERLELSDVNGDGFQDAVVLTANGASSTLRYKLNLGFGNWAPATGFTSVDLNDLPAADLDFAALEDIDGDGLSDIVVVSGSTVRLWRNRSDAVFDSVVTIASADVDGDIPARDGTQTVLFADMNGNGTDDVVWVSNGGRVRFLELFPVRPNLLASVDNGIGWVRSLTYGTSGAERARDEGTAYAWPYQLPQAMQLVKTTDSYTTLTGNADGTGLHERLQLDYHAGYYDPADKAFRGFETVERLVLADDLDSQDPGREVLVYDVGRTAAQRHGLLLRRSMFGGEDLDVPLREERTAYADCAVADVGAADVRWACAASTTTIHQEGRPQDEWLTTQTDYEYDGYGNITLTTQHGVVHTGPPQAPGACPACADDGLFGGYCGAMCLGDELTTEMTFVVPGADTSGAWLARLPARQRTWAADGGEVAATITLYDGPDFIGLDEGKATRGLVSRVMMRADQTTFLSLERYAHSAAGDVVTALSPNGSPTVTDAHRRDYEHGQNNLRVTKVTVRMGDYDLVQDVVYEPSFKLAQQASSYYAVQGGSEKTSRNVTTYTYDEHGRVLTVARPGDTDAAPTERYRYELAAPVSRVTTTARPSADAGAELVSVACLDGTGRTVQTRSQIGASEWLVSGFNVVNGRNTPVRSYQPYTSASGDCEVDPPADVLFTATRYDALGRPTRTTLPDESLYGTASERRTVYLPLGEERWDAEDADATSPHADTPVRLLNDGLDRPFRAERLLTPTTVASYEMRYDDLGNLAELRDPAGNVHSQVFDLAGRVTATTVPDSGTTTFGYDDNGNVTSRTDARGITTRTSYDSLNRSVAVWDDADEAGTRQESVYDFDDACAGCDNGAGRPVTLRYPQLDGQGSDELGYDARGRLVLRRRTIDGTTFVTTREFDGANRLVKSTYPDGRVVEQRYDRGSRPAAVPGVVTSTSYTASGQLAQIERANGVVDSFSYDALQRLASAQRGGSYDVTYTRDRLGDIVSQASAGAGISRAAIYDRDAWHRVTEATLGADSETLATAYDLTDNITSATSSLGSTSAAHRGEYRYDGTGAAGPHAVTSAGDLSYSYDAGGFVTERGGLAFGRDHFGRVSSATDADGGVSRFAYASDGTRVLKEEQGGVTYYPSPDFVVRDGISSVYVRLGDEVVARQMSDGLATTVLADGNGDDVIDIADAVTADAALSSRYLRAAARRLLFADGDETTQLHAETLGSIVVATDESGAVRGERAFYPFGAEREADGFVDYLGFSGQEQDESTGMLVFQFRSLDPASGRWLEPDPAFAVVDGDNYDRWGESTTGYAYVGNNPIDERDPAGLSKSARRDEKKMAKLRAQLDGTYVSKKSQKRRAFRQKRKKLKNRNRKRVSGFLASKGVRTAEQVLPPIGGVMALVRIVHFSTGGRRANPLIDPDTNRSTRFVSLAGAGMVDDRRRLGISKVRKRSVDVSLAADDLDRAGLVGGHILAGMYLTTQVLRASVGLPNMLSPSLLGKAQDKVLPNSWQFR